MKQKESALLHEVVAALIIESGKILLGQRFARREFYPGVWDVFGGHIETGETHEQTLVRELQEELGITPTHYRFLETITVPSSEDPLLVHLYLVTAWDGTPENIQRDEHSTIGWFSLEEAVKLQLADSSYPVVFARYLIENQ